MSGTIAISPDARWSAAGWLFDWTIEFLASNVTDDRLADDLREIARENLGWLGLDDFGAEAGTQLRDLIGHRLVAAAEAQLPSTVPNRAAVIDLLRDLSSSVSGSAAHG